MTYHLGVVFRESQHDEPTEYSESGQYHGAWSLWSAFDRVADRFKADVGYQENDPSRGARSEGDQDNTQRVAAGVGNKVKSVGTVAVKVVPDFEGFSDVVKDSVIDALRLQAEKLQEERNQVQGELDSALAAYDELVSEFDRERVAWEVERQRLVDERDLALYDKEGAENALADIESAVEGLNSTVEKYV